MSARVKASEGGGVLGSGGIVDVAALSHAARYKNVRGATGNFTQNSTVKANLGPLGFRGTLKAGYLSFVTLPVGGTLTVQIVAYDATGNAEVVLTEALDAETPSTVSREGTAFVLAATNVALNANDTIEVHTIASNATVSTQQVGGMVSLMFDPTEADVVDQ